MHQDYEHTEHLQDLMDALARAQAHMKNPIADSTNPHLKSRYPSLAVIRDAVMPPLTAEGIALTQLPITSDTHVGCVTVLWYKDQYLKSTFLLPLAKADPQACGSALTYARRYSLLAICNLAGDEDDDGNQAKDKHMQSVPQSAARERRNPTAQAVDRIIGQREREREVLLREIHDLYNKEIVPLKHSGMYKAIFFHSFHLDKPEQVKEALLEALEAGMPLYRHLTAQLVTWDRTTKPDDWIAEHERLLEVEQARQGLPPEGIDPDTGEDHRLDATLGWATAAEQREQHARDEAALLEQANA